MAYGFTIDGPSGFDVPLVVSGSNSAMASTDAVATAQVVFWEGTFQFDTSPLGFGRPEDEDHLPILFNEFASVNILADDSKVVPFSWGGFIAVDQPHTFFLVSQCRVEGPFAAGDVRTCVAIADPTIEFDQAAFDDLMGEDTFSLADTFEILYSPGFESINSFLDGDANNDGFVTGADLISVQQNFGTTGVQGDLTLQGDANRDGAVTGADLIRVQQNFGKALAPSELVPEPIAMTPALLLAILVRRARRK